MLSKLNIIKETLLKVTNKVYHYQALKADDKYIVWAEDSEAVRSRAIIRRSISPFRERSTTSRKLKTMRM